MSGMSNHTFTMDWENTAADEHRKETSPSLPLNKPGSTSVNHGHPPNPFGPSSASVDEENDKRYWETETNRKHNAMLDQSLLACLNGADVLILGGECGLLNQIKGNSIYRSLVGQFRPIFQQATVCSTSSSTNHQHQTEIVQCILESVWANDGRFLEFNRRTGILAMVPNSRAAKLVRRDLLRFSSRTTKRKANNRNTTEVVNRNEPSKGNISRAGRITNNSHTSEVVNQSEPTQANISSASRKKRAARKNWRRRNKKDSD